MSNTHALWLILAASGLMGLGCSSSEAGSTTASASASSSADATSTGGAGGAPGASEGVTTSSAGGATASSSTTGAGGSPAPGGGTGGAPDVGGTGGTGGSSQASGGAGGGTGGAGAIDGGTGGGAGGSAPLGPHMVINEVVADETVGSDWIELFNAGDQPADLTGWTMTDSDPTHVFAFDAGTMVAPGAYLTFDQNAPGSFTFGLGKGGDQVNLYDAGMLLVDGTEWVAGEADAPASWGRLPNGTGLFQTLAVTTKGAANQ